MPPRKAPVDPTATALTEHTKNALLPTSVPKVTEKDIIEQIRIGKFTDAKQTRKLIMTAFRNKSLYLCIGIPPGSPRGHDEPITSPDYFYEGDDLLQLEHLLLTPDTILDGSATLVYGDGGNSIESNEEAAHACNVIQEKYREPILYLHF